MWGQIFGGIWQGVSVGVSGPAAFCDVCVRGDADGLVVAEIALSGSAAVGVELRDPTGELVAVVEGAAVDDGAGGARARLEARVPAPRLWSPGAPALYEARVRAEGGDERALRFGLRTLAAAGAALTLNGRPLYPRLALSWGWYPESLHSSPGPARVRADLLRLKELGYNGVKLCLWFPPAYYFELADELGMLLWVELPLWLPQPGGLLREQLPIEYGRLLRQARVHPAVILYSLGCELGGEIGAELLAPLYRMVKALAGDALVRDNSGSGEAFGGLLDEHADYDDHHFYSDLQFLPGLLDRFAPRWRPPRPWLLGEFCDLDSFRDLRRLGPAERRPWWATADAVANPQGARGQHDLPLWEERLRAAGLWERGAELERISERQALLHRKWTLELVRAHGELAGYVVTGEADTPVSSAGMWDDAGRLKFAPAEFRAFNDDLVLLLGWGRRRAWVAGGDRAAFWDTWSYPGGATVRAHLIGSNYGDAPGPAELSWEVALDGDPPLASGELADLPAPPSGAPRELAVAEFVAPDLAAPRQATLRAELRVGELRAANSWPLWVFPANPWRELADAALIDPAGRLADLPALAPGVRPLPAGAAPPRGELAIATAWTTELAGFVTGGGAAVLLQAGASRCA